MTARIFKPAKNAMQSGAAKTKAWQLDYEPEQPRVIEPLMGWTSSGDMKQQLTLRPYQGRSHRVLREGRDCLPGARGQGDGSSGEGLCGQFRIPPPRALDALTGPFLI